MRDYKKRIERYNMSEKYQDEMAFMIAKINKQNNDIILDYGCGTGYMARKLGAYGFDVNNYNIYLDKNSFTLDINKIDIFFNKVYFMHSLAHIDRSAVSSIIETDLFDVEIFILTPDKGYLDKHPEAGVDETAKHFYKDELEKLILESGLKIKESLIVKDNIFTHACPT